MRDLVVLFLHLLTTVARFAGLGGARAVVAESVLIENHMLILNLSRRRAPTATSLIAWSPAPRHHSSPEASSTGVAEQSHTGPLQ